MCTVCFHLFMSHLKVKLSSPWRIIKTIWLWWYKMFQLKFWWTEWIRAGLPCRPECWWAWSRRCILKESSSGSGGESQAWRGPAGHSGSFPTQIKKVRCENSWWRQREMLSADVNLLLPSQTGTAGIFGRTRCTCWKTKRRDRQIKKKKVGLLQPTDTAGTEKIPEHTPTHL